MGDAVKSVRVKMFVQENGLIFNDATLGYVGRLGDGMSFEKLSAFADHDTCAIDSVKVERERQDEKWGEQNHYPSVWLGILGEEFGELCQAVNETWFDNGPEERAKGGFDNMRAEAVQVAAVAVAFVEYLDRRKAGGEEL